MTEEKVNMETIHRFVGHVILNTDAIEIAVAVCGLLILWIVGRALIRRWKDKGVNQ